MPELGLTAVIGAKVADILVGYAVGKFLDHAAGRPIAKYFEDRATKLAFRAAAIHAVEQMAATHPGHQDFFDESFVEHRLAPELAVLLTRNGQPDPKVIAKQYSGYFQSDIPDVEAISADFVSFLDHAMREQPQLSALMDSRQIDSMYEMMSDIRDALRSAGNAPVSNQSYAALPPPMAGLEQDAVVKLLGRASRTLLSWPQTLVTGTWIERREVDELLEAVTSKDNRIAVLLGSPGSGKSALLAHLGERLEDTTLLAIKADRVPREVASLADLGRWLELNEPPDVVLTRLADQRPVVVLLDQMDALCELIDQHTQRLSVLIELVQALSEHPNIHIVMTCRGFEFSHDIRFQGLGGMEVQLALPEWDNVQAVLVDHGFQPEGWPQSLRDMLCTPQQLNVFLRFIAKDNVGNFDTYQQMLEEVWRQHVLPPKAPAGCVHLLEDIATRIAEREELWVTVATFDDRRADLDRMIAAGVLKLTENARLVGFSHQTLFDFARARAFASEKVRLSDHVLERQNGLFIRPTLWSALTYLRGTDAATLRVEFERIWNQDDLRVHIRDLLTEFLTQQSQPTDWEAALALTELEAGGQCSSILMGMAGSQGWFVRLAAGPLPKLMTRDREIAFAARRVLGAALRFEIDTVLSLIEAHWLPDPSWDEFTVIVLDDLPAWDERSIRIAETCFRRSDMIEHWKGTLTSSLSVDMPEEASRLIRASFDRSLEIAKTQVVETPPPLGEDADEVEQIAYAWQEEAARYDRYKNLIEDTTGWSDIVEIAEAAPVAFIDRLWPWLLEILNAAARDEHPFMVRYRDDHSLATSDDEEREGMRLVHPVWASFQHAVDGYADNEPERFIALIQTYQCSDVLAVHRLLMRGLVRITEYLPNEVLEYLLGDPRRMIVGDMGNGHRDTQRVIRALVPHLTEDGSQRLEQAILSWSAYYRVMEDWTAKDRRDRIRWDREHRLRLLNSFPENRLTEATRRFRKEENRALFPVDDRDSWSTGMTEIGSPMSTDQMALAKNSDVLNLFEEIHDDTDWDHPRHFHRGGSVQASRSLADLSKKEPGKAIEIISQMHPGKHERPVGYVVEALAQSAAISMPDLIQLVMNLSEKGFSSDTFRTHAADALRIIAKEPDGLPNDCCELLEAWLTDWEPPDAQQQDDDGPADESAEPDYQPILWASGRLRSVPRGNYPTLQALTMGYLLRRPSDFNAWLGVLERHLGRKENPYVWRMLGRELRWLRSSDQGRALEFVDALLAAQPGLHFSAEGAVTLAWLLQWIPKDCAENWLSAYLTSDWEKASQAFGELITHRYFCVPSDACFEEMVIRAINDKGWSGSQLTSIKIGIAHSACNYYVDRSTREKSANLLSKLMVEAEGALARAITDVFRLTNEGDVDSNLVRLLDTMTTTPVMLSEGSKTFMISRLIDAISVAPETVCRCCEQIVELNVEKLSDMRTGFSAHTSELVDVAITLQRYPLLRDRATDLFESLQRLNVHGVAEALHDLDRHPRSNTRVRRRRRRKAR
ncbi:NACHT domain-containing protein [Hwanghaeella sp. LZ110]|uniref:NACHT domain-containing protein n=1 Tax=Hwanghaeella sp. LZ110 TaxID=3402810 RepID=UPI003B67B205